MPLFCCGEEKHMTKSTERIVACLKEMIDKNGPSYLTDEPYEVFQGLVEAGAADRKTAGALLYILASGSVKDTNSDFDEKFLSEEIRKGCGLNKKMADQAANILHALYSSDHKTAWENKELEGWRQFLAEDFTYTWKGFAVWDAGSGTVDCHYEAEIILTPTEAISADQELAKMLKKNPFMTKNEIHDLFAKRLKKYLDVEFEDYCTEDDYYQPVVEDFGDNMEYDLPEWCKKNGFELVSFDGDGDDDGYEPKFRRGWH